MELLELFVAWGGHWMVLLTAVALVLATRVDEEDALRRWQAAFSTPAFATAGTLVALAAWAEHYARLQWGLAYLRGSGALPHLPLLLLPAVLGLAAVAWLGARRWPAARPWLSLAIVLLLVVGAVRTLGEAPAEPLGLADRGPAVRFAQQRLEALGCFAATCEPPETDGLYGTATHEAVTAFQLANGLDRPRFDLPFLGRVRPRHEWLRLKRPFTPPQRCGVCAEPARWERREP
ncbi:MAG TPA: peptidoglycan-binding domain-containing protein [Thermoanaerobaculia bacterium]|nr:peptidoglycan-binding domain-containing protein [Thermoanaerobaculia bacterium]